MHAVSPRGRVTGPSCVPCPVSVALQLSSEVVYGSVGFVVRLSRLGWGSVMFSGGRDSSKERVEQLLWVRCAWCVARRRGRVSRIFSEGSGCRYSKGLGSSVWRGVCVPGGASSPVYVCGAVCCLVAVNTCSGKVGGGYRR